MPILLSLGQEELISLSFLTFFLTDIRKNQKIQGPQTVISYWHTTLNRFLLNEVQVIKSHTSRDFLTFLSSL